MKNRVIKTISTILVLLVLLISCDNSTSTSPSELNTAYTQSTDYNQEDSNYWNLVFEDFYSYMNVNYVFWDQEANKDGELQVNQSETDWDEIYSTYSSRFIALNSIDDVVERNYIALNYFNDIVSTLIDHHYYVYFKDVIINEENESSDIYLESPSSNEIQSRDYYNEAYQNLDFSQYAYYNFEDYDTDGVTLEDSSNSNDNQSLLNRSELQSFLEQYNYDCDGIDVTTALKMMSGSGEEEVEEEDSDSADIALIKVCNIPTSLKDNLSNVSVYSIGKDSDSEYSSKSLTIISALFDSDDDGVGDTPYLYLSKFYLSFYANKTNDSEVISVLDNFYSLVFNSNETGSVNKIIFDFRHNPGGSMEDLSYLVAPLIEGDFQSYCYTRYKSGDNRCDYTPLIENKISSTTDFQDTIPDVPVVVLLDIYSASMSEITTIALNQVFDSNVIIMGQRSFGATGPLTNSTFLSGSEDNDYYYLYTSANALFDLDRISYEGIGLTPTDGYDSGNSTIEYDEDEEKITGWKNDSLLLTAVKYLVD